MNIKVNVKQPGAKRNKIAEENFTLEVPPETVRELICGSVHTCVKMYSERRKMEASPSPISDEAAALTRKSPYQKMTALLL